MRPCKDHKAKPCSLAFAWRPYPPPRRQQVGGGKEEREKGDRSPLTQKGFLANLFMLRCLEVSLQVLGSTATIDASVVKVTRYRWVHEGQLPRLDVDAFWVLGLYGVPSRIFWTSQCSSGTQKRQSQKPTDASRRDERLSLVPDALTIRRCLVTWYLDRRLRLSTPQEYPERFVELPSFSGKHKFSSHRP